VWKCIVIFIAHTNQHLRAAKENEKKCNISILSKFKYREVKWERNETCKKMNTFCFTRDQCASYGGNLEHAGASPVTGWLLLAVEIYSHSFSQSVLHNSGQFQ
jgi:hypothetical protein